MYIYILCVQLIEGSGFLNISKPWTCSLTGLGVRVKLEDLRIDRSWQLVHLSYSYVLHYPYLGLIFHLGLWKQLFLCLLSPRPKCSGRCVTCRSANPANHRAPRMVHLNFWRSLWLPAVWHLAFLSFLSCAWWSRAPRNGTNTAENGVHVGTPGNQPSIWWSYHPFVVIFGRVYWVYHITTIGL